MSSSGNTNTGILFDLGFAVEAAGPDIHIFKTLKMMGGARMHRYIIIDYLTTVTCHKWAAILITKILSKAR